MTAYIVEVKGGYTWYLIEHEDTHEDAAAKFVDENPQRPGAVICVREVEDEPTQFAFKAATSVERIT